MRQELLLIEKIEQYLEGKLSPQESALFEKQMRENPDLQTEVELQRQITGGLERAATKKKIAAAFIKYKKAALLFKLGMMGSGAAVVGVATTLLLVNQPDNSNSGSAPHADTAYIKPQIQTMPEVQDTVTGFSANTSTPDSSSNSPVVEYTNYLRINRANTVMPAHPQHTKQDAVTPVDTAANTENPAVTAPAAKTDKSSTAAKALSEKEKKKQLSAFFINLKTPVTWLGMDFSQVRLLDKDGNMKEGKNEQNEKFSNSLFGQWNALFTEEKKRYDIAGALRHASVSYSTDHVNSKNDTIQVNRLYVQDKTSLNHIKSSDIQNIVNTYPLENKTGYGLVFIVESLDRQKKETNTWVALIDMKTRQVLIAEKMYANVGGIGMRNYWARGFHNTINDIKERKYEEWKAKK
jgi:hypothetical protein